MKKIAGYSYYVSPEGCVTNSQGRQIQWKKSKGGWPYLLAFKGGKPVVLFIADLVARLFIGKRKRWHYIKHKDGNVDNCNVSNLEYVSRYVTGELWKTLRCTGYEVSSTGRVRVKEDCFRPPLERVPVETKSGHLRMDLYIRGERQCGFVHTVVARAFLGVRPEGKVINHKDGNPRNNCVSNLEYVTRAENNRHASDMGLVCRGEDHPEAKLTEDAVRQIRKLRSEGLLSRKQIAERFGVCGSVITNVCKRIAWKHVN